MSIVINMIGGGKPHNILTEIGTVASQTPSAINIATPVTVSADPMYFQQESDNSFSCVKAGTYFVIIGAKGEIIPTGSGATTIRSTAYLYKNDEPQMSIEATSPTNQTTSGSVTLSVGDTISLMGKTAGNVLNYPTNVFAIVDTAEVT